MGGIWGQLSVGLFADPLTGPKGIFLGGGPFQLVVQLISSISLSIWAATVTLGILWIVNKIIPIRLDLEEELKGCDEIEHDIMPLFYESQIPFERIVNASSPKAQRFAGSLEDKNHRELEDFERRRSFHTNLGYQHN